MLPCTNLFPCKIVAELAHPLGPILAPLLVWSIGWQWATWISPPPSGSECPTCIWQARTRRSRGAAVRVGIFLCVQRPTCILISCSKLCWHMHLRRGNLPERYWVSHLTKISQLGFKKSRNAAWTRAKFNSYRHASLSLSPLLFSVPLFLLVSELLISTTR